MTDVVSEPFFVLPADASPDANAELVGSKAAQLARMSRLGLPVPPAFVMPTSLCNWVNRKDESALRALHSGLRLGIARLKSATGAASAIAGRHCLSRFAPARRDPCPECWTRFSTLA